MLRDSIGDDSKSVRMAVARQLSSFPADQLPESSAKELKTLFQEYLDSMNRNADMPEEQINLGVFYAATGDPVAAEKAYRHALKLSPVYLPALLNLADLYRANGMDQQAEPLLRNAIDLAPGTAAPRHAMGLLMVRQGKLPEALPYLQTAAAADPGNVRFSYVYAVALWETGEQSQAAEVLESALGRHPGNQELVSALASYYQQLGEEEKLRQIVNHRYNAELPTVVTTASPLDELDELITSPQGPLVITLQDPETLLQQQLLSGLARRRRD